MARQLKFTVGGFFDGYKTVEIFIDGKNVSCKILRSGLLNVDKKIFTAEMSDEWLDELDALNIFAWEKDYINPHVLDGTQWDLNLIDGEKIYRGHGSNAYPADWEKFLDWLDALIPELEFVNRKRLEHVTLEYSDEKLTLDRRAGTLTLDKKNSRHIYDAGENIKNFFDACQNIFDDFEAGDVDLTSVSYVNFELVRHDGSTETFTTLYNENFLPGLTNFLNIVKSFMSDLTAKIFTPDAAQINPQSGKYIFCKVRFNGTYKLYTYQTDDETLAVGDIVDVPVGRNNDVNQARIVEIGYYEEYEAPFPVDRIKKIIGKHVADEWENY